MRILMLLLALVAVSLGYEYPKLIALSSNVVLVQCTPEAFGFVRSGCGTFIPKNPDCDGERKYTWTIALECATEMIDYFLANKDPFEPNHGSLISESTNEPFVLTVYKDDTEREEL